MGDSGAARPRGALPLAFRILLVLGFLVAVGATALVVFADDVRMLRLAALLALWAALIAAFAVTRSRRDARTAAMRQAEAQLAYQLELHREVSARREYEAELTRQVAAAQSDQLAELREQLERLTSVLSSLTDGEVTVSRLTLSAESTRFRSLAGAERSSMSAGASPGVTAGGATVMVEAAQDEAIVTDGTEEPREFDGPERPKEPEEPGEFDEPPEPEESDHSVAVAEGDDPESGEHGGPPQLGEDDDPGARAAAPAAAWALRHRAASQQAVDGDEADHHPEVSVSDLLAAYGLTGRSRRRRHE